jgi:hypothetical protein
MEKILDYEFQVHAKSSLEGYMDNLLFVGKKMFFRKLKSISCD